MKEDLNSLTPETTGMIINLYNSLGLGEKVSDSPDTAPSWYDAESQKVDEVAYCAWFMDKHPLKYVGGLFYDIDGLMRDEDLIKEIVSDLKPYVKSAIVRKAGQIAEGLKYDALCDELPRHTDRVHFSNGTFYLEGGFIPEKEFCSNRLPVSYNPDAPEPAVWLKFLDDLLYPEDKLTLQEFMGYSLTPNTRSQSMFILIGSGGEGKSRIGFVCRNLLGDNMNVCSLNKLSSNRFAPADQEGKLLMIDDDMRMEALSDTGMLKAIVTMEDKMDLEKKGKQSYQGYLYVRIMAFGNGALSSLYDKSDGFYRRQIVIRVKEKPEGRVDDRNLSDKLAKETEGIALWCLEGLKRLVANGFHFTISERTKANQAELRREEDSILDFLESEGYISFDEKAFCTTKDFYEAYRLWCEANLIKPRSETSFSKEIKELAAKHGITYLKNVAAGEKTARGYKGVYALHTLKDLPFPRR